MADDETTRHGCRRDNFRALAGAEWRPDDPGAGYITFTDGSRYRVGPTTEAEFRVKVLDGEDPGCWFNKVLRARPDYFFTKLGGPS